MKQNLKPFVIQGFSICHPNHRLLEDNPSMCHTHVFINFWISESNHQGLEPKLGGYFDKQSEESENWSHFPKKLREGSLWLCRFRRELALKRRQVALTASFLLAFPNMWNWRQSHEHSCPFLWVHEKTCVIDWNFNKKLSISPHHGVCVFDMGV